MTREDHRFEDVIDLLWRTRRRQDQHSSPGPRPKLDVDRIVEAAVRQSEGRIDAEVSMRAIARGLGVTPMTLYGYVPDKDALVALMYDAIHADVLSPAPTGQWHARLTEWAEGAVDVYVRYPWSIAVAYGRPVLGPNEQRVVEDVAVVLRQSELLDAPVARAAVGTVLHMVRGTALAIASSRRAVEESGLGEGEWWQQAAARLAGAVPDFADRFPATTWLMSPPEDSHETPESYVRRHSMANLRAGLRLLFDGIVAQGG